MGWRFVLNPRTRDYPEGDRFAAARKPAFLVAKLSKGNMAPRLKVL
jgi:hypothetical protein